MSTPALLTPKDVAQQLQVSTKTVFRLINNGQLTAVRIGRLRRVTPAALAQFVRQRERNERTLELGKTGVTLVQ